MADTLPQPPSTSTPPDEDDLEFLSAATLTRRAATAASPPSSSSRRFFFKPNADCGALILAATRKLEADPGCVRARMIRARALMSAGVCGGRERGEGDAQFSENFSEKCGAVARKLALSFLLSESAARDVLGAGSAMLNTGRLVT